MNPKLTGILVCVLASAAHATSSAQGPKPPDNARFEPGPARATLRYWQTQPFPGGETDSYPRLMAQGATVVCFVPGYKEIGFDHKGVRFIGPHDRQLPLADQNGNFDMGPGAVDLVDSDRGPALRFSLRIPADAALGMRSIEFFGKTPNGTDVSWVMDNAFTVTVPMVFIVDIDGMRQDLFYRALRNDSAGCPTLRLLAGDWKGDSSGDKLEFSEYEHAVALRESTTIFPTVTIVGHASIFTGSDLRRFRMGGNGFFDRTIPRKYGFCGYDKYDSAATFRGKDVLLGVLDGLANERALSSPGISTVYQDAYAKFGGMESVVFCNMYFGDRTKKSARWEFMTIAASAAYPKTMTTPFDDAQMFERARKDIRDYEAYDYPRTGHPMGIMTLYANGVDHLGHEGTSPTLLVDRQMKHLRDTIEPGLRKFCQDVPEAVFKVSHFVFIADHGQTDLDTVNQGLEPRIRSFSLGRSMPKMHKLQDLLYEYGYLPDGDYTFNAPLFSQEFSISPDYCGSILGHNGGVAHVYLRRLKDPHVKPPECTGAFYDNDVMSEYRSRDRYFESWDKPPFLSQVLDVAELYWKWNEAGWAPAAYVGDPEPAQYRHSLEVILVRDTEHARPGDDQDYWGAPYNVYQGGGAMQPFSAWLRTDRGARFLKRLGWSADERDATWLADRLTRLNGPMSGDILLLPFYPDFYSEPDPLQGDHGSMMRQDFMVPFVVARPGGLKPDVDRIVKVLQSSVDLASKSRPATTDIKKTVLALLPLRAIQSTETSKAPKPFLVGRRGKDAAITVDMRWSPFAQAAQRADGSTYTFRLEGSPNESGPFEKLVERHIKSTAYGLQSDSSQYWSGTPEQIDWREQIGQFEHFDSTQPVWIRAVYVERPGVEIASDPIGPDEITITLKLAGSPEELGPAVQITEPHEVDLWPGRCDSSSYPSRTAPIARFSVVIASKDGTFQPFDLPFEYTCAGKTWHAWTPASRGANDWPVARIEVPLRPGDQLVEVRALAGGKQASRSIRVTYAPPGRPALDPAQASARYVNGVEAQLVPLLADKDHRDAKRFISVLRDALAAAVHDGYGVEATNLWTKGSKIYQKAHGRELAAAISDSRALAFGKAEVQPEQMPASALSTALFWAALARLQLGDFDASTKLFQARDELMTKRAAAQEEVTVPWLGFDPVASRTLPLVAQLNAWSGQIADAVRAWDEYQKQYMAANPNTTADDMTRGAHTPPDWYSPKNRSAPAPPPVTGGGDRPTPGLLNPFDPGRPGIGMPEDRPPPPNPPRGGGAVGQPIGGERPEPPVVGQPQPQAAEHARELARSGKPAEALAAYDAAISSAPQDATLRGERGTLRMWNNDLRGARDDWAAIAKQSPDNLEARKFAAALELVTGDPRASLAQYQELARALPADPLVLVGQAQASLFSGDQAGAQRIFQQASRMAPQLAGSLYEQANQMLSANVPAIAHAQYTAVVWLDPSAYHAYYGLGFSASRLGYKQEAINAFERFLQRDSASQFADNARAELERLRKQ